MFSFLIPGLLVFGSEIDRNVGVVASLSFLGQDEEVIELSFNFFNFRCREHNSFFFITTIPKYKVFPYIDEG